MSWSETLLDAFYRGVPIQVMSESLQAQRSLAEHGVPYQDGDEVEDLGRGARTFAMTVVLWGDNYEIELQNLLTALDTLGPGELIHPIYGRADVVAREWTVQHTADRPDYAEVSLTFLERTPAADFFAREFVFVDSGMLDAEQGESWQQGLLDLLAKIDVLVADVQRWIGGGWVGLMEQVLGLPGIGLRLMQLRTQIGGILSGLVSMLETAGLRRSGSSGSGYDPLLVNSRVPTDVRAAIFALVDPEPVDSGATASAAISTTATARLSLTRSMTDSPVQRSLLVGGNLPTAMPGANTLDAQAARAATAFLVAGRQGTVPASADLELIPVGLLEDPDADPIQATAWAAVIMVLTETALAQATAVADLLVEERNATTPTLTPLELESVVGSCRALLLMAIELQRRLYGVEQALRVIEPLRAIAALVLAAARQVALLRPPIVSRTVQSDACLRLLAHRWYGDHSRAAELLRLNPQLSTPYNVPTGTVLRVYAQ
ncbi:DNA circularization protein [Stutzerimonas kirkiae]|uniref:DNA circularization protein n=1 Tax=Stutzerimonas kirkiae TaxID=2211392 RepID=UPI0010383635|nr:DNA circularization N-terminal domain-containing protein [Stutzerimonas kirkiae]TBV12751.1 hypothetical protein DNK01_13780 [Stutzerimonas kirkiae]